MLGFCQTDYPKKIELNSDTVIVISSPQLRQINRLITERDMFSDMIEQTEINIEKLNFKIIENNVLISDKNKLILMHQKQENSLKELVTNGDNVNKLLKKELRIQKMKTVRYTLIGSVITGLITATVISLKK